MRIRIQKNRSSEVVEMEELLKGLFDYQKFAQEPALQSVIDEIKSQYRTRALTDDDVSGLFAAGDPDSQIPDPPDGKLFRRL